MNTELILTKVAVLAPEVRITEAYKHYLERPVIEGFTVTYAKDELIVKSESTSFVHRKNDQIIEMSTFEEKISELRSLAKKKKCKLKGINNSIKQARENYSKYFDEVINSRELFAKLVDGWYKYQIHDGYSEDVYYNQHLEVLEFRLQKMHYMNTWLMRYRGFMWTLDEAIKELSDDTRHYTMMNVHF
ncbi:hypothetical protein [Limosilactobacillus reuteri]|uniref:hypothetical protein n=1 Tax=Limosilactobacillus reuteri TaxID=1598 RepID=UPI000A2DE7E8|nr:hypothetical protein [Limosilactobacillus reuteri]OTA46109.1 hypothetical protein BHL74_00330 [Limosilactobacillus reuteri]